MTYANFESVLEPEEIKSKIQMILYIKHVACGFGYNSACADEKFSKPFQLHLVNDVVYNFVVVPLKKVNIIVMWWKHILTNNL